MPEFIYGCRNRPPMMYAVPQGYRCIVHDPHPRVRYGFIAYDRKLTPEDIYRYELIPASDNAYEFAIGDPVLVNEIDEATVVSFPGPGIVRVQYGFDPTEADDLDWRVVERL